MQYPPMLSNINLVSGNKQYADSCGQWHNINCLTSYKKMKGNFNLKILHFVNISISIIKY